MFSPHDKESGGRQTAIRERDALEFRILNFPPCGCDVRGAGTLPDPVKIVYCPAHAAATSFSPEELELLTRDAQHHVDSLSLLYNISTNQEALSRWERILVKLRAAACASPPDASGT